MWCKLRMCSCLHFWLLFIFVSVGTNARILTQASEEDTDKGSSSEPLSPEVKLTTAASDVVIRGVLLPKQIGPVSFMANLSNGVPVDIYIFLESIAIDIDIRCSPGRPESFAHLQDLFNTAPWISQHFHGEDYVFISRHHPQYNDAVRSRNNESILDITCFVANQDSIPGQLFLIIDIDENARTLKRKEERALNTIFQECCEGEKSCIEWKEHRNKAGHSKSDLCHFHTNICTHDGQLKRLNLEDLGMSCPFPSKQLSKLTSLSKLLLNGNNFTGNAADIFSDLSSLEQLELVDISLSPLTGSLVHEDDDMQSGLCKMAQRSLIHLNLANCTVGGQVPACLLNKTSNIKVITLPNNNLTGELPVVNFLSTKLIEIDFSNNRLTGEIPAYFTNGSNLEFLQLARNQFTGEIPPGFGSAPILLFLTLNHNNLTGTFPEDLTSSITLAVVDLSNNQLSGEIPESISYMRSLNQLYLTKNQFSGQIPSSLGGLRYLYVLNLGHNRLTGPIPSELGQIPGLLYLDLSENRLKGNIPETFVNLRFLRKMDFRNNSLSGPLPDFLYETETNSLDDTQIYLQGNDFEIECPLPNNLTGLHGLTCEDAEGPDAEGSIFLQSLEIDLDERMEPKTASLPAPAPPAESQEDASSAVISLPAVSPSDTKVNENAITVIETESTTNISTNLNVTKQTSLQEPNGRIGTLGDDDLEVEEHTSSSDHRAIWIPICVVLIFALLVLAALLLRRTFKKQNKLPSRKKPPVISLSSLAVSSALPQLQEPAGEDDAVIMLEGAQSSAEIS